MDPDIIKSKLENLKKLNECANARQKNHRDFIFRHVLIRVGKIICSFVKILIKEEISLFKEEDIEFLNQIESIVQEYIQIGNELLIKTDSQPDNWADGVIIQHGNDSLYYPRTLFSLRERIKSCSEHFFNRLGDKYLITYQTDEDDLSQASDFKQLLKLIRDYANSHQTETKVNAMIEEIMRDNLYMTKEQAQQITQHFHEIDDINIKDDEISIHKEQLGSGGFGTVVKGTYLKTSEVVAVKKIRNDRASSNILYSFYVEIQIMHQIRSPYVLKLVGAHVHFPFSIITRFCAGKSLYERLHKKTDLPNLTSRDLTKIAYQVALGMKYLHENEIVHRDLKTHNILLDEHANACVADLGLSIRTKGKEDKKIIGGAGTFNYTAPEILADIHYTPQVDVYSYAIVLWEMLLGKVPFADMKEEDIYNHVVRNNWRLALPQDAPTGLVRLITQAWSKNPRDRPTFAQIVEMFRSGRVYFKGQGPNQDDDKIDYGKIEREKHCPNLNKEYLIAVLKKDPKYLKYFDSVVEFIVANMDDQIRTLLREEQIIQNLIEKPEERYSSTLLLASAALLPEDFEWFLKNGGQTMFVKALDERSQQSLLAALTFATQVPRPLIGVIEQYIDRIVNLLGDRDPISDGIVFQILTRFNLESIKGYLSEISHVLLTIDPSKLTKQEMFDSFSVLLINCREQIKQIVNENDDTTASCIHFASFISDDYEISSKLVEFIINLFQHDLRNIPVLLKSILRALHKSDLTKILINMTESIFGPYQQNEANSSPQLIPEDDEKSLICKELANDKEILDLICKRLNDNSKISSIGPLFLLFCLVRFGNISSQDEKSKITKALLKMHSYTPQKLQIFTALTISEEYCKSEDKASMDNIIHLLSASQTIQGQHLSTTALRLILAMSSHLEGCQILEEHDVFDLFQQNFLASNNPVDMIISYNIIRNAIKNNIKFQDIQIIVKYLLQSLLYEMSQKETILDTLVAIAKLFPDCIDEKELPDYILFKLEAPKVVLQSLRLLKALNFQQFRADTLHSILIHINQILAKSNYFHPKIIAAALNVILKIHNLARFNMSDFLDNTDIIEYAKKVLKMDMKDDKRKGEIEKFISTFEGFNESHQQSPVDATNL